ncbi:MAG: transketolase [Gammaproteobacteria bacterium]|nr:transketolase [Gammaproteobacteria bacterium]
MYDSGSGHVGSALSQTDILVALYRGALRVDPKRPDWPQRDRFVLSKGHGGLGLAAVLADCGFINPEDLSTFGKTGSALGMHMHHRKLPAIEAATGSLGHGLGIAVGMALGVRLKTWPSRTICLLSDGECYEGSTWEAALAAGAQRLHRLLAVVDRNRLTMDGFTEQEVPLEPLADKWASFGWRVINCDGHDFRQLCSNIEIALAEPDAADAEAQRPTVILAQTIKGKGVDFMENEAKWHYGALDSVMYARALASVRDQHKALS